MTENEVHRTIRVPEDIWNALLTFTRERNTTISAITRDFYRWWLNLPDAELPTQTPAPGDSWIDYRELTRMLDLPDHAALGVLAWAGQGINATTQTRWTIDEANELIEAWNRDTSNQAD